MYMGQSRSDPGPIEMKRHIHSIVTRTPTGAVQLPRHLERPPFAEPSRERIKSALPELVDVPTIYIAQALRGKAQEMMAGIRALAPAHIPRSMNVHSLPNMFHVPPLGPSSPTHVLAIVSSKTSSDQAFLFPVHDVVLVTHCHAIRLPPRNTSLPVVRIALPSYHAFSILHTFMYGHRLDHVLGSLLPLPVDILQSLASHHTVIETKHSSSRVDKIASHLCSYENADLSGLMKHVAHLKDMWQCMVITGMYMLDLWDTLDLAWDVVLYALTQATRIHNSM